MSFYEELSEKQDEYCKYITDHKALVEKSAGIILPKINFTYNEQNMYDRIKYHDLSKFSIAEFNGYRQYFYPTSYEHRSEELFDKAWKHHYQYNDHHYEHWIKNDKICKMSTEALLEMFIDWYAMSLYFGNSVLDYYKKDYAEIILHPDTRDVVEYLISYIGKG